MAQYHRGRRKEWVTRDALKEKGYVVGRIAGSRGLYDLQAFNRHHHLLVQVKYSKTGKGWKDENCKLFKKLKVPTGTLKQIWVFTKGRAKPEIHRL